MTQEATLPDPLVEVAPPRGRSGGAAWAIWLARRLGLALMTLWLVSIVVFLATAALGDPVRAILGRDYGTNIARREQLEAQLGIGDSIVTRYFDWLGGLLTGDFGTSLANQQPVWGQISSSVVNSLVLVLLAAVVMVPLAFGIAMISSHFRRRRPDTVIQTILLALAGVPEFVTGILLVSIFSTTVFKIFPAVTLVGPGGSPWDEPEEHGAPGRDAGDRGDALRLAHRAGHPPRGPRQRLRRAGPPQGHPRAGGDAQARAAQRDRARHPGRLAPARVAGRRRGARRDPLPVPRGRPQLVDSVRNHDVAMVQALSMIIAGVYIVVNLVADVLSILLTPERGRRSRHEHDFPAWSPRRPPRLRPASSGGRCTRSASCSVSPAPLLVVLFAILAPLFAPYGEKETAGPPYSKDGVFGTDYIGQDVLSRVMHGGQEVLTISVLATVLGMVGGILIGVVAAYAGGWWDEIIMRLNDVLLAFPQILLSLVVLTALQNPSAWVIILLVAAGHAPRVARVARGVALGIVTRDFVVAAEALGEKRSRVIVAEVLPNMTGPLLGRGRAPAHLLDRHRRRARLPRLRRRPAVRPTGAR